MVLAGVFCWYGMLLDPIWGRSKFRTPTPYHTLPRGLSRFRGQPPSMCCRWGRPAKPMFSAFPGPHHGPKGSTMHSNPFSTTFMAPPTPMGSQRARASGAMMLQSRARWKTGVSATTQARKNGRVPENQFLANSAKLWSNCEKWCANKSCGLWLRSF